MEKQALGTTIASLRKAHGMTKLDLSTGFGMVGVSLVCISLTLFRKHGSN